MTTEEIAAKVIAQLFDPAVREQLAKRQKEIDAYFKELRQKLTPTYEDIHRPFDI